jgi:hypothetical protein
MCDTRLFSTSRKPNNYARVHNEDSVILSHSFIEDDGVRNDKRFSQCALSSNRGLNMTTAPQKEGRQERCLIGTRLLLRILQSSLAKVLRCFHQYTLGLELIECVHHLIDRGR